MSALALGACTASLADGRLMASDEVEYSFELRAGPPRTVRITLRVRGKSDGTSRLAVAPRWADVERCERFIHRLSVRDHEGNECLARADSAKPNVWSVSHKPGATLVAAYDLRPATPDPLADFKTHYEPVVRDDLLHLIGETAILYPEWMEETGPVDIRVNWSGFSERGLKTATSFDSDEGRIHRTLRAFRHAMFFAGRLRIVDRAVRGGLLRVAIYGDDWDFKVSEFVDLVERIVTAERSLMDDYADPYFLVTVVPTGPPASPESLSLAGTGLTQCFALFLPPRASVNKGSSHRREVLRLLAHEYFHNWNGAKISPQGPEELFYWFSEGFTDFYASRILRTAGLIDDAEWVSRLNDTLKNLWLSPVATASAETIRREFWARPEVNKLPYHRGEIVALTLDEEIRRGSGGARTLDDFMRERLAEARRGESIDTDRLLDGVARWTSSDFAMSLRSVVVEGALPVPPSRISQPRATRDEVSAYRYEPGFDVEETIEKKSVSGVRPDSVADAAGLRDGQQVDGFSIHRGDPDMEIKLTIRDGGQRRFIKFLPRGNAVRLPTYRLDGLTRPYPLFEAGKSASPSMP